MAVALKPISGIVAIPPSKTQAVGELSGNPELSGEQLDPFRAAGWRFVATTDPANLAEDPTSALFEPIYVSDHVQQVIDKVESKPPNCRAVYRNAAGQVVIEGAGITVKFAPTLERQDIESILKSNGLYIGRQLGFVPNGFDVRLLDSHSALNLVDLANKLAGRQDVEYAEPATIESIGGRGGTR